jgi:hypothetical protein
MTMQEWIELPIDADRRVFPIPPPRALDRVVAGLCESASEYVRDVYLQTPIMTCYTLSWKQAPALLTELERLGITAPALFPGYAGAARGLFESRFQGQPEDYHIAGGGFYI